MRGRRCQLVFALLLCALSCVSAHGQSLDERLDEDAFLRGLADLQLPEVLDHYLSTHVTGDPVDQALRAIALQRLRMQTVNEPAARLDALESLLTIRREQLIEAHPGDQRRALWLLDQASDLYFDLLAVDASGLTTLLGVPTTSQTLRSQRCAREMLRLTAEAELALDELMRTLETLPADADRAQVQLQRRRIEQEQVQRRLPFMRGIALTLDALTNQSANRPQRDRQLEHALPLLQDVGARLTPPLSLESQWWTGIAHAYLGNFDDAESAFRSVATSDAATDVQVFQARMGGVLNRVQQRGPESGLVALESIERRYDTLNDLFERLLLTDQRFRLQFQLAATAPPEAQNQYLREAYTAYATLLDAQPARTAGIVRDAVFRKLRSVITANAPLDDLPPIVSIARASALVQDEHARADGIALYRRTLGRHDLSESDRAMILLQLGHALAQADHIPDAVRTLRELARDYTTFDEAEAAMQQAAQLAYRDYRESRDDESARTLLDTLAVMFDKHPYLTDIDQWRFIAARLELQSNRCQNAIELLDRIPRTDPRWLDARFLRAAAYRRLLQNQPGTRERSQTAELLRAASSETQPDIVSAQRELDDALRARTLRYYADYLRLFEAEALIALQRQRSALDLLALFDEVAHEIDPAILAGVLQARIRAFDELGDPVSAQQTMAAFLETDPEQASIVVQRMLNDLCARVESLQRDGRSAEAGALAAGELRGLAQVVLDWRSSRSDPTVLDPLNLSLARSLRLAGLTDRALALYDSLLAVQPTALDLLFGRAECLVTGDDPQRADAMQIYKRLIAAGVGDTPPQHDVYWTSQLRQLQVLDQLQRNTRQIVPRIRRLQQRDPELGGTYYRRQFEALLAKYD
jgi:hypothetical protein